MGDSLKMLNRWTKQFYILMCNFLEWVKRYIDDYSLTMICFFDWLSSK